MRKFPSLILRLTTVSVKNVLAADTVTVSTTAVTATSVIVLAIQTPGGTVGAPYVNARPAGPNVCGGRRRVRRG
ncbi:hypothetical protein ACF1GS_18090 [Streptomyces eurythermus]|uniref:hypothetical protein n=1 Tax=Streptomyces eurythermus TaxID=42237 RepID=UPI0036FBEB6A